MSSRIIDELEREITQRATTVEYMTSREYSSDLILVEEQYLETLRTQLEDLLEGK